MPIRDRYFARTTKISARAGHTRDQFGLKEMSCCYHFELAGETVRRYKPLESFWLNYRDLCALEVPYNFFVSKKAIGTDPVLAERCLGLVQGLVHRRVFGSVEAVRGDFKRILGRKCSVARVIGDRGREHRGHVSGGLCQNWSQVVPVALWRSFPPVLS